jgi:hypothetical protein
MPHYDAYGNYQNDQKIEFFDNCIDKTMFNCPSIANSYKTCFIDNKNKKCCETCKKYTNCEDKSINCPNMINDTTNLNNEGKCSDNMWLNCCSSCQIKNNELLQNNELLSNNE